MKQHEAADLGPLRDAVEPCKDVGVVIAHRDKTAVRCQAPQRLGRGGDELRPTCAVERSRVKPFGHEHQRLGILVAPCFPGADNGLGGAAAESACTLGVDEQS